MTDEFKQGSGFLNGEIDVHHNLMKEKNDSRIMVKIMSHNHVKSCDW